MSGTRHPTETKRCSRLPASSKTLHPRRQRPVPQTHPLLLPALPHQRPLAAHQLRAQAAAHLHHRLHPGRHHRAAHPPEPGFQPRLQPAAQLRHPPQAAPRLRRLEAPHPHRLAALAALLRLPPAALLNLPRLGWA